MPIEVAGSEKLMTTALAVSRPALHQHVFVRRVTEHHRIARLAGGADPRRIEVERDVFEALRFQHPRDVLADATEAAQDDVLALRRSRCVATSSRRARARRSVLAQQEARDALLLLRMNGTQHHRQHDGHQQGLAESARDQPRLQQSVHSATPNSPPIEITMPVRSALNRRVVKGRVTRAAIMAFSTTSATSIGETDPATRSADQQAHVEQHADGDEEQPEQDVAERADHRFDLMSVLGLREHHSRPGNAPSASDSPARFEAQADASTTSSTVKGEQLAQPAVCDLVKQRPQQPAAGRQHTATRATTPPTPASTLPLS